MRGSSALLALRGGSAGFQCSILSPNVRTMPSEVWSHGKPPRPQKRSVASRLGLPDLARARCEYGYDRSRAAARG